VRAIIVGAPNRAHALRMGPGLGGGNIRGRQIVDYRERSFYKKIHDDTSYFFFFFGILFITYNSHHKS